MLFYGIYQLTQINKPKPVTEEEEIQKLLQQIEKEMAEEMENDDSFNFDENYDDDMFSEEHLDHEVLASWKKFEDGIAYIEKENKEDGLIYMFPKFSEDLKRLNGTIIELEGFIFPTENLPYFTNIIMSPLPSGQCYFCSNNNLLLAEVNLKKSIKFTNDKIKVRGVLNLNSSNPEQAAAVINDAELVR